MEQSLLILALLSILWMILAYVLKKNNIFSTERYLSSGYAIIISFIFCGFFWYVMYLASSLSRNILEIKKMRINAANVVWCWFLVVVTMFLFSGKNMNKAYVVFATIVSFMIFVTFSIFISKTTRYFFKRKPTYLDNL